MSILIPNHVKLIFFKKYGMTNLFAGIPNTADAANWLASIHCEDGNISKPSSVGTTLQHCSSIWKWYCEPT